MLRIKCRLNSFSVVFCFFIVIALCSRNCVASGPVLQDSFADIVEPLLPAVVNISTTQKIDNKRKRHNPYDIFRDLFEKQLEDQELPEEEFEIPGQNRKGYSLGSGFIIDSAGYIVTNYHVIDGADEVNVRVGNDDAKSFKAKVIGKDQKTDLALLKIESPTPLPYVKFGSSEKARVGDKVLVIGNPFGLGGTVTSGIISAMARYINSGHYDDFIQTDASINRGNSGGPMFNLAGEVIGVTSVIFSPSGGSVGIGFAIPSSMVEPVIKQLKEKGEIVRGWLGVKIQAVTEDIASGLGLKDSKGALVASVVEGSPASKSGIRTGDIITKFDGKEISIMNKLPKIVGETQINKVVKVEFIRDGGTHVVDVVVEKPSSNDPFDNSVDSKVKDSKSILGMHVQPLTPNLRKLYNISEEEKKGVVITKIDRNSIAGLIGVKPGDVVVQVNKHEIASESDFEKSLEKLKKDGKGSAVLLVSRGGNTSFITISLN